MKLTRFSPCKVNLLLNILGRRPDGFHELETVMQPVAFGDELEFDLTGQQLSVHCDHPSLPIDDSNLVTRAAKALLAKTGIQTGVRIRLNKRIPMAAGLGGGSSNAAATLIGLNELLGQRLDASVLHGIAATLGSDVPFFLQTKPALATGRGEKVQWLEPFPVLRGAWFVLARPGFGISTPWAYRELKNHPSALNGQLGRAKALIEKLRSESIALPEIAGEFFNSLEAPAFNKFPWLRVLQDFMKNHGAAAALMSGSGSTTFALVNSAAAASELEASIKQEFGAHTWIQTAAAG